MLCVEHSSHFGALLSLIKGRLERTPIGASNQSGAAAQVLYMEFAAMLLVSLLFLLWGARAESGRRFFFWNMLFVTSISCMCYLAMATGNGILVLRWGLRRGPRSADFRGLARRDAAGRGVVAVRRPPPSGEAREGPVAQTCADSRGLMRRAGSGVRRPPVPAVDMPRRRRRRWLRCRGVAVGG